MGSTVVLRRSGCPPASRPAVDKPASAIAAGIRVGNSADMSEEQSTSDNTRMFREARDFLVAYREDYETAHRDFA